VIGCAENNCCQSLAINLPEPVAWDSINGNQQLRPQMFGEHHGAIDAAVRFFSDLAISARIAGKRSANARGLAEGGAEMLRLKNPRV
jgi:hypothetical protein